MSRNPKIPFRREFNANADGYVGGSEGFHVPDIFSLQLTFSDTSTFFTLEGKLGVKGNWRTITNGTGQDSVDNINIKPYEYIRLNLTNVSSATEVRMMGIVADFVAFPVLKTISVSRLTAVNLSNINVADGAPSGTEIGTLTSTGGTSPYTYTIIQDSDNYFQINGDKLELSKTSDAADSPVSVTVRSTDLDGQTVEDTFSIVIESYVNTSKVDFDGVDEHGVLSSTLLDGVGDSFSVSAWIEMDTVQTQTIFSSFGNNALSRVFLFDILTNKLRIQVSDGSTLYTLNANDTLSGSTKYHVVAVVNGSTGDLTAYVDGSEDTSSNTAYAGKPSQVNAAHLGTLTNGSSLLNFFDGKIDEVSLWDKALTASDVTAIYNSGTPGDLSALGIFSDCAGWWRMGEDAIYPTIPDEVGSNDMTLTNTESSDIVAF